MRPFMTRSTAALFIFFALGSTSHFAYAAPAINQEGAAELQKIVDSTIKYYTNIPKTDGNDISVGTATVTPKDKFYEVLIPNVKLTSKNKIVDVGTLTINASPNDKGEYLTSMALPTSIMWKSKDGRPMMELKTGEQKFAGVFLPALQTFSTVNAEYKNMVLTGKGDRDVPFTLKIDGFKNILNLTENGDKTWSGYNDATVTGVDLTAGGGEKRGVSIKVGNMSTKAFYDKMNLALAKDNRDKVQALYKDGKVPTGEELQKTSVDLIKNSFNLLDAMNNKFELNDLSFNTTPAAAPTPKADATQDGKEAAAPAEKPVSIKVGHIASTFDARGIMQDIGSLNLKTAVNKISTANMADEYEGLVPKDINIELYFDSVPMKQLTALLGDLFTSASENGMFSEEGEKPEVVAARRKKTDALIQDKLSGLPALLVKSGSSFSIRNTYVDSEDILSTLEGKVSAQAPANGTPAIPATGSMTLSVQGLDEMIQSMQGKVTAAPAEKQENMTTIMQSLALFQMFGQPNKAANGKSLRVYKLDLSADGKVLLNGKDLGGVGGFSPIKP